jgi:tRNA pseudouridine38-40 synthase
LKKIAMLVAYDGGNYKGFQIQINGVTIQEKLEEAIETVTQERCRITCAGRTDSGVHATGQVVTFNTSKGIESQVIKRALNAVLPHDIRINACVEAKADFNPRQDATRKTYSYVLNTARVADPFMLGRAWHVPWVIDRDLLAAGAAIFYGSHDFKAFSASGCSAQTFNREIYAIEITNKDSFVVLDFTANGFLYNMVRILTGTIVEYASGRLEAGVIREALQGRQGRRALGQTAPPQGLYLRRVEYPEDPFAALTTNPFFMW